MRTDGKIPQVDNSEVVVHNVHILDASGSMSGGKYTNALKGINSEIMEMRKDPQGMTQTIIEFAGGGSYLGGTGENYTTTHYFMTPAENCTAVTGRGAGGGTPLYQTVGEAIEKLLRVVKPTDKVLMKIFTDGEENTSQGKYKNIGSTHQPKSDELTKLIKMAEDHHNFTITFMGTKDDVENMVENMKLRQTNTLVHMNTAESIGATYSTSRGATIAYRKELSRGASQDELKQDFFKRVSPEQEEKTNS